MGRHRRSSPSLLDLAGPRLRAQGDVLTVGGPGLGAWGRDAGVGTSVLWKLALGGREDRQGAAGVPSGIATGRLGAARRWGGVLEQLVRRLALEHGRDRVWGQVGLPSWAP